MDTKAMIAQVEHLPLAGGTRVHFNPGRCPLLVNGGMFLSLGDLGLFYRAVPEAIACPGCQEEAA